MRASRLVNLLLLLQSRGGMTAAQLAAELEVSERTIHRDVQALAEAGVPVYAERGPTGGIRLVGGYRTRLTGLTTDEAEGLFLSGVPGAAAELGLGTVVAAARLKVLAALPPELRSRATRVAERFHLDAPGWFHAQDPLPHLGTLASAVWDDRRVRIEYRRPDRAVTREIEPLGLVLKGGVWYVVARSDGQERTYRVGRVLEATVLDERFERPAGFDLAAYWSESIAAYEQEARSLRVVYRLAPGAEAAFPDAVGDRAAREALEHAERTADGSLLVTVMFEWADSALTAAFHLGGRAELVEPDWLRAAVVDAARAILAGYEAGASSLRQPAAAPREYAADRPLATGVTS
jgi:predicted DNA-binding transcriptional regulator YafY